MSRLAVLALGVGLCSGPPRAAQADDKPASGSSAPGDRPVPDGTSASGDKPAPAEQLATAEKSATGTGPAAGDKQSSGAPGPGNIAAGDTPARSGVSATGDEGWRYRSAGSLTVDSGLVVGFPAALPTGLATGVGAGVARGKTFAIGARAAWVTATESSLPWTVTHGDLRLRLTGAIQATPGRGVLGLRLGLGGTLVHETRVRNQGMRAGLTGSDLEDSAFAMLPAADLDAVVALHIAGPWLLVTSGGPSLDVVGGKLHAGWSAELGVAWQP